MRVRSECLRRSSHNDLMDLSSLIRASSRRLIPPISPPDCDAGLMVSNILLAIGVICLILGVLALLHVIAFSAPMLLIIAVVCLVLGYFLRGRPGTL